MVARSRVEPRTGDGIEETGGWHDRPGARTTRFACPGQRRVPVSVVRSGAGAAKSPRLQRRKLRALLPLKRHGSCAIFRVKRGAEVHDEEAEGNCQLKSRRRVFLACAAIVALVGVAFTIGVRQKVQVRYHWGAMMGAWSSALDAGHTGESQEKLIAAAETHRRKLVSLGALERRTFPLQHIRIPSESAKGLWRDLEAKAKGGPFVVLRGYEETTPDEVVVWAPATEMPEWAQLIDQHDRP